MEKAKKIALYIGSLQAGGSERHVIRLLEGLPKFGYQVALIVNSKSGALLDKVTSLGIEMVEIPISPSFGGRLSFILGAAQFLWKYHFDIVQCYNDISVLYITLAAWLARTRRVVFSLRNTHQLNDSSIKTNIIGWLCKNFVWGVIVNSCQISQQMTNKFRMPAEHIKIIYNGIGFYKDRQAEDASQMRKELGLHSDKKTIGIVARLDPVKRIDVLIKAAILLSDIPVQFLIVGDGQERTRLISIVETAEQSDRFIFVGNKKDPLPWISAFDIGILCSESEGFPQAILEYMAVGLPVVASAVGGISELVLEGETGFLVSSDNIPAFATALRRLMEDQNLSKQMGQAGQKRAREFFSLEKEILSHINAYQSWLN